VPSGCFAVTNGHERARVANPKSAQSGRYLGLARHRDGRATAIRVAQDVMATPYTDYLKATVRQSANHPLPGPYRQRGHYATPSTSTSSESERTSHGGTPSPSKEARTA
jgi:hypothetical protein